MRARFTLPIGAVLLGFAPALAAAQATTGLEGRWSGEILNAAGEVRATISFELERFRADTLHGAVTMTLATGTGVPGDRWATRTEHQERYDDELHIDFVDEGGQLQAMLSPYRHELCGCALTTILTGRRSGDRIEGTYQAHHRGSGLDESGAWWVELERGR